MKINTSEYIVALLIAGVIIFGLERNDTEKATGDITRHEFKVPPIEIRSHGGVVASGGKKMQTTCMQLAGCNMDEVIRIMNKYDIPATPSKTTSDPNCIDIAGEEPFYKMTVSRDGDVTIIFPSKGRISQATLEQVATEIYWAH
ncbi:MAG: hypothetical protein AAB649_07790 [Patescibacteria group bacterium]